MQFSFFVLSDSASTFNTVHAQETYLGDTFEMSAEGPNISHANGANKYV
jgi:hypothetical protein